MPILIMRIVVTVVVSLVAYCCGMPSGFASVTGFAVGLAAETIAKRKLGDR